MHKPMPRVRAGRAERLMHARTAYAPPSKEVLAWVRGVLSSSARLRGVSPWPVDLAFGRADRRPHRCWGDLLQRGLAEEQS